MCRNTHRKMTIWIPEQTLIHPDGLSSPSARFSETAYPQSPSSFFRRAPSQTTILPPRPHSCASWLKNSRRVQDADEVTLMHNSLWHPSTCGLTFLVSSISRWGFYKRCCSRCLVGCFGTLFPSPGYSIYSSTDFPASLEVSLWDWDTSLEIGFRKYWSVWCRWVLFFWESIVRYGVASSVLSFWLTI